MKFSSPALFACLAALLLGQPVCAAESPGKLQITEQIRQEDGRVVERLVLPGRSDDVASPMAAEVWAKRSLDPAWMAELASNPELFSQYLDAATEPRFMTALATMAADRRTHAQRVDPELLQRLTRESGSSGLQNWAMAGVDPRFYLALFSRMASPYKAMRWATCNWTMDLAKAGQAEARMPKQSPPGTALGHWFKLPENVVQPAHSTAY